MFHGPTGAQGAAVGRAEDEGQQVPFLPGRIERRQAGPGTSLPRTARAARGHAAAPLSAAMNSRRCRLICPPAREPIEAEYHGPSRRSLPFRARAASQRAAASRPRAMALGPHAHGVATIGQSRCHGSSIK
jgi:hypothetical protein